MTLGFGGRGCSEGSREVTCADSPHWGELRAIARQVVVSIAAGSFPDALRERLCGAALVAGSDAGAVAVVMEGGPHAAARALQLAGQLLLRVARESDAGSG